MSVDPKDSNHQFVRLLSGLRKSHLGSSEPYDTGYRRAIGDVVRLVGTVTLPTTILRLRFALQSAWPYVHENCTIEAVRNEVGTLMNSKDTPGAMVDAFAEDSADPFKHLLNVLGTLDLRAPSLDARRVRDLAQEAIGAAERIAQYPAPEEAAGDRARQQREDKLHRDFLTSILEYHDYAHDEVAYEEVVKAIERRAQDLNSQLSVSVHEIEAASIGSPVL
jgi:hypothetical protein